MSKNYLYAHMAILAVLAVLLCGIGWYCNVYIFSIVGALIMMGLIIIFSRK